MTERKKKPGPAPRLYELNGRKLTLTECAAIAGLTKSTLVARLRRGWPLQLAVHLPPMEARTCTAFGRCLTACGRAIQPHQQPGGISELPEPARDRRGESQNSFRSVMEE
ncbi:hypothetical protein [Frigidibacter oleivorans]|uniref:hypothetical protein n=1 Tax=Frigidibacter oleivorans TaxID=2487129 RepID=UPI000F8CE793|nr:hypothetical protein [Frigidibacter oleivorans]